MSWKTYSKKTPSAFQHVPAATGSGNGYVRGLETLLVCEGASVNCERLMGLSGMAFILQADTEHRWEGNVDAGRRPKAIREIPD